MQLQQIQHHLQTAFGCFLQFFFITHLCFSILLCCINVQCSHLLILTLLTLLKYIYCKSLTLMYEELEPSIYIEIHGIFQWLGLKNLN